MNAVNPVDQLNAVRRIQQALETNPRNTDAMFELATMQEKSELKRKLLNKILSIDPVNKPAREMLLELDRAEMDASRLQPKLATTSSSGAEVEKSQIFRYSLFHRFLVYAFMAFSIYFMFEAFGDWDAFIFFTVCFLILLMPLWFVSAVVKVNGASLGMSGLFGIYRREVEWNEIDSVKPAMLGGGMRLILAEGGSMTISAKMHRFSAILETLSKTRADLLNTDVFGFVPEGDPASFAEPRIFQGSPLIKYVRLFLVVILGMIACGTLVIQPLAGLVAIIIASIYWVVELTHPHTVKVQGNRLQVKSFLKQQEWIADQIKDISIVATYSGHKVARFYGVIPRRYVRIEPINGKAFRLIGFAERNETMYTFLMSCWRTYRNK